MKMNVTELIHLKFITYLNNWVILRCESSKYNQQIQWALELAALPRCYITVILLLRLRQSSKPCTPPLRHSRDSQRERI